MDPPTKGSLEAQVANAVVRFQREQQGRGPTEVRAHIIGDLVLVRCTGVLTHTEVRLAGSDEGCKIVRSARHELQSMMHDEIEQTIGDILGARVLRSYSDVDVGSGELMEVYVLAENIEGRFRRAV